MICVVEDDPNIREIEVYAMKDCHMETKEASCAKEFWKLCENEVPELVLLDIMLPDEDGISIVKNAGRCKAFRCSCDSCDRQGHGN